MFSSSAKSSSFVVQECIDGSYCPGSNNLLLEMGYFSTPEAGEEVRHFAVSQQACSECIGSSTVDRIEFHVLPEGAWRSLQVL